jgi:hypothetical protein
MDIDRKHMHVTYEILFRANSTVTYDRFYTENVSTQDISSRNENKENIKYNNNYVIIIIISNICNCNKRKCYWTSFPSMHEHSTLDNKLNSGSLFNSNFT